MESPRGRILAVYKHADPPHANVEVAALRCARCAAGKGCGAGALGGDDRPRRIDVRIPPGIELARGDNVRIELPAKLLLRASLFGYGLPLGGAIAGASAAWFGGTGDAAAALAALAGMGTGILAGRLRLRRAGCLRDLTPSISMRLATTDDLSDHLTGL